MVGPFKVCTICTTYNQALFIRSALEGFVLQCTSFPVVTIVVDDASTDNNASTILDFFHSGFDVDEPGVAYEKERDYARVCFARHKTNRNCFFAVILLKENHYSSGRPRQQYYSEWFDQAEYIARCEGDDYWTDPLKLERQVSFLDSHPDYSLTCHRYKVYDYEDDVWSDDGLSGEFADHPEGISFGFSPDKWYTKTLSLVYRAEAAAELLRYPKGKLDRITNYFLLKNGLGFCFNEFWGVYRRSVLGIRSKQSMERIIMREYRVLKDLYEYEPNRMTREMYYSKYPSALTVTKGKLLFRERFEPGKVASLLYYGVQKVFRLLKRMV